MLTYYHGTDGVALSSIMQKGANISCGGGELGQGYYIGSSMWRAFSWAWQKARKSGASSYGIIEYQLDEARFYKLSILCKNRRATQYLYKNLKCFNKVNTWISNHDAIWAPIVGMGITDMYQIKFESTNGRSFINSQHRTALWP